MEDNIKTGNFQEPRSRQEIYLQAIAKKIDTGDAVNNDEYPEPRSRQEAYLQLILMKIGHTSYPGAVCDGKIRIIDENTGKTYIGELKIINGKPALKYEEKK